MARNASPAGPAPRPAQERTSDEQAEERRAGPIVGAAEERRVSAPGERSVRLRAALDEALAPTTLEIIDESHLHAGHAGALTGKGHFRVCIVAAAFAGMPPIKRHRMVYAACAALLETDIHALSIEARAPGE